VCACTLVYIWAHMLCGRSARLSQPHTGRAPCERAYGTGAELCAGNSLGAATPGALPSRRRRRIYTTWSLVSAHSVSAPASAHPCSDAPCSAPQVSVERTLGTVVGGLIGLGVVQLGDSLGPFLSATDTAFTSTRRPLQAQPPCLGCILAPLHFFFD